MTAIRATKVPIRAKAADAAALDVLLARPTAWAGFKRVDVAISRTSGGGLHVDIEVPAHLSASVAGFLAALGVKGQR
jgi:hypothetical protein